MPVAPPKLITGEEQVYTRSVFEAILAGLDGSDDVDGNGVKSQYVLCEDGARVKEVETAGALAWHPYSEVMAPGSPNPLDEPWLRFPFTARQLAALMTDGWGYFTLQQLCVDEGGIQTGPFGSQLHQSDYSEEGVPVVMPKDLATMKIDIQSIARIPEHLADELGRHRLQRGDIVFGRRGEIGRRAYIGQRQVGYFCGTGCLRLRPDPARVHPRFLFEILRAPQVAGDIANRAKGSTMANLSAGALQGVPVPVPPREMQNRFATFADDVGEQIDTLDEQSRKLRTARDLLLPRLMSGALTV